MPRGNGRKLLIILFFISIFTLLLLNSFAFAESLINKGTRINYKVFEGKEFSFTVPEADEYYDDNNDYSIIIQEGISEEAAKIVQSLVNKLPGALIPTGAQLVIVYEKTATLGNPKLDSGDLGARYKNQIYFQAEELSVRTIVHEIAHYTEGEYLKYSESKEYKNALCKDLELNGNQYASEYAESSIRRSGLYSEQFAEVTAFMYKGIDEADFGARENAAKMIKDSPNQAKFIIEEVAKEAPLLPDGVNYEDLIGKALAGSSNDSSNNAGEGNDSDLDNINNNSISSYLDDNSLDNVIEYDSEYYYDEEESDDESNSEYYYFDEEDSDYEYDGEYYFHEEDRDDDSESDYNFDLEDSAADSDSDYYVDDSFWD